MKAAFRALLPGGVVLLAALIFLRVASPSQVADIASTYGLVVNGAGVALAWVFHRSRAFIVLCILAWIDIGIVKEPAGAELVQSYGTVVLALIALLAVTRDRGVASRAGSIQVLAVSAVAALGGVYFRNGDRVARFAVPADEASPYLLWQVYPALTLLLAAVAFLAAAYGFQRYRGPVERSFVWCLILLLMAMHPDAGAHGSALFLMATGLTVTLSVVETSYVMAYRDELTGLPGRRALMEYLDGVQGMYTVAMVDVDHFKKVNDRHGHDVGDQVLQLVASRLARAKGGAKAYRYGGEEFTLLYPGRTADEAVGYVEEVKEAIGRAKFSIRSWRRPRKKPEGGRPVRRSGSAPKTLSVKVSVGMADADQGNGDRDAVLKRADEALYRAKRGGRDTIAR